MLEVAHAQKRNPLSDLGKILPDIPYVITCAKFADDRFRDLWVAGGQILPFLIDFDRRFTILALPCECLIFDITDSF